MAQRSDGALVVCHLQLPVPPGELKNPALEKQGKTISYKVCLHLKGLERDVKATRAGNRGEKQHTWNFCIQSPQLLQMMNV